MRSAEFNHIPTNQHVLVVGLTGCGKSVLCEHYTAGYQYVVKLDTKDEYSERKAEGKTIWRGLTENRDFVATDNFDDLDDIDTPKIIYRPPFDIQEDVNAMNDFFHWIFLRGNTVLWVDELMMIGNASRYPKELGRIATQGRSKNVGLWSCTQRPSGIPNIIPANTTHFFIYNQSLDADRKKMIANTGQDIVGTNPGKYCFWYYKVGEEHATKGKLVL